MPSDLGAKALGALLEEFEYHTNPRLDYRGGDKFAVVADLYHDCDRVPSYSSTDDVLDGLDREEAEILAAMLKARNDGSRG